MSPRKKKTGFVNDAARRSLSRLERILLLIPYCVKHPGVTIGELAKRFGAPEREILEDLNLLFVCGLPDYTPADLMEVFIEEDMVFIRMADYFARPLRLTRTEAIPLYLKAQALVNLVQGSSDGKGLRELASLRSALEKLGKALLPQEGGVAELTKRIKVQLESGEAKWLGLLRDSAMGRRSVDLEYYTYSRDNMTRRKVDPHLVFASFGHWYFSGYCHMVQDKRMFRLDRIKSLALTDETFEAPEEEAELPPPLIYAPSPEDVRVKIKAKSSIAQWLSEMIPFDKTKDLRGDWKELEFRTSAFPWLEKLLLRAGSDVQVIEPVELADRMRDSAKRILALYR
ncbi:MAG: WYL domain-containing protein [Actinomycetota bacterium]